MAAIVEELDKVDPYDETFLRSQTVAIIMAKDKINRYVAKGRIQEAQGALSILNIMYSAFRHDQEIDSGWGEL